MDTNKELVEHLNSLKITQKSGEWNEDIPEDIYEKYFEDKYETVIDELDIDKHRWYELSIEVIKINNGFIGILNVSQCYSESSTVEDMYHTLEFFEMEEVMIPSYIKI